MSILINIDGINIPFGGCEQSLTPHTHIPPQGMAVSVVPVFDRLFRGDTGTLGRRVWKSYDSDVSEKWLWQAAGTQYYVPVREDGYSGNDHSFKVGLSEFGQCKCKDAKFYFPSDTMDAPSLTEVPVPECSNAIIIHKKPWVRRAEYFCTLSDGRVLFISANDNPYSYASFRMWLGTPGCMVHHPITKEVERWKDGGTTYVHCNEFVFHSPTSLGRGTTKRPSIKFQESSEQVFGILLTKTQIMDYRIMEDGEELRIERTA